MSDESPNLLSALPIDVLKHAVSFLTSSEALQLHELNSSFRDALPLSTLTYSKLFRKKKKWSGATDTPIRSVWIPVLFPHRTHSIVLTCRWRDQGWGNRKGTLFIVAVDAHDDPNTETLESIENGKIVYQSPLAAHQEESLQMSFSYSPSKAYYLWYRIGGGGGHELHVNNLFMHTIIHDSPGQWIGRNYHALDTRGFLKNSNDNFLQMLRLFAAEEQEEYTETKSAHLNEFLEATGFDRSEASMMTLEEIAAELLEFQRQDVAHYALPQSHNENHRDVSRAAARGQNVVIFPDNRIVPPRHNMPALNLLPFGGGIGEAMRAYMEANGIIAPRAHAVVAVVQVEGGNDDEMDLDDNESDEE